MGPVQMTTDTAVRVTRTVIQKQGNEFFTPFAEGIEGWNCA